MTMKNQNTNPLMLISEISISYQPKFRACDRPKINCSEGAYNLLYANWDLHSIELHEKFAILLLNNANHVIGMAEISSGGYSGTCVDPRMVFSIALKSCCSSILLCHNHPSGVLTPSAADISITSRLAKAGELLGIEVVDHLIISRYGYLSLRDEGLMCGS